MSRQIPGFECSVAHLLILKKKKIQCVVTNTLKMSDVSSKIFHLSPNCLDVCLKVSSGTGLQMLKRNIEQWSLAWQMLLASCNTISKFQNQFSTFFLFRLESQMFCTTIHRNICDLSLHIPNIKGIRVHWLALGVNVQCECDAEGYRTEAKHTSCALAYDASHVMPVAPTRCSTLTEKNSCYSRMSWPETAVPVPVATSNALIQSVFSGIISIGSDQIRSAKVRVHLSDQSSYCLIINTFLLHGNLSFSISNKDRHRRDQSPQCLFIMVLSTALQAFCSQGFDPSHLSGCFAWGCKFLLEIAKHKVRCTKAIKRTANNSLQWLLSQGSCS